MVVTDGPWAGAYTPMLGYWRDNEVESFDSDELLTGDLGFVDTAGNLIVRDRKKLLIIRGGANVYPAEVERVLDCAPGVCASAVLGIPIPARVSGWWRQSRWIPTSSSIPTS